MDRPPATTASNSASSTGSVRASWDVVIEPDDEYGRRVFNVSDEQLHAFVRALVNGGVQDFRVVRLGAGDPFDTEPGGVPWPELDDYIPV